MIKAVAQLNPDFCCPGLLGTWSVIKTPRVSKGVYLDLLTRGQLESFASLTIFVTLPFSAKTAKTRHTSHHFIYRRVLFWSNQNKTKNPADPPLDFTTSQSLFRLHPSNFFTTKTDKSILSSKTARPVCQDRFPRLRTWLNKFQRLFFFVVPITPLHSASSSSDGFGRKGEKCQEMPI